MVLNTTTCISIETLHHPRQSSLPNNNSKRNDGDHEKRKTRRKIHRNINTAVKPKIKERDSSLYLPQDRILEIDPSSTHHISHHNTTNNNNNPYGNRNHSQNERHFPSSSSTTSLTNSLGLDLFPEPPTYSRYSSFNSTTYDLPPASDSDIDIDIDLKLNYVEQWKSHPRSVSFSTTDLLRSFKHKHPDSSIDISYWARDKLHKSELNLSISDQVIDIEKHIASPPKKNFIPLTPLSPPPILPPSPRSLKKKKKYQDSIVDLLDKMTTVLENRKNDRIGGWPIGNNNTDEMASPPPVPARSRLRSVASSKQLTISNPSSPNLPEQPSSPMLADITSGRSSMNIITHKQSSSFRLPVDPPMSQSETQPQYTPSLRSPVSPASPASVPGISPNANETTFTFGKKKGSKIMEKDPMKIRDGVQARTSTSGVYTPMTFPGAQGPRPSHFPTHVYTPSSFALPLSPSESSSQSSSSSQSDSTVPPKTPLSPTGRITKVMSTNIRRFSNGIVSLKDKSPNSDPNTRNHQRAITTPMMEEHNIPTSHSFESNTSAHSRGSSWASWGPSTPQQSYKTPSMPQRSESGYFPTLSNGAGLGVGLDDLEGKSALNRPVADTIVIEAGMDPLNFAAPKSLPSGGGSLAGKGKRKPVPRLGGGEEPVTHAY
ncbi:uncharacterized protein IL334_003139 [Kwoniella shivajii]|uniref:Uncharacterized protein n=1 Tax=Kwoniella shivajii TaxID=564305 RepID=A0ABZ1CZQ2_9TREE|nr:hypothetical protein IL334_003139 [Kwoniella shivajii]